MALSISLLIEHLFRTIMLWVSIICGPCKQIDLLVIVQRVLVSCANCLRLNAFRYNSITVNTFTEHLDATWSIEDMQHT